MQPNSQPSYHKLSSVLPSSSENSGGRKLGKSGKGAGVGGGTAWLSFLEAHGTLRLYGCSACVCVLACTGRPSLASYVQARSSPLQGDSVSVLA